MREPNILLDAIIDEAGMSHDGLAARVNRLGARDGLGLLYDHASVRRWIRDGTIPRGRAPELICEVLSARLGRTVMLADVGMDRAAGGQAAVDSPLSKVVDHAAALWRSDFKQAAALRAAPPVRGPAAVVPVFEWENPPDDLDVARPGTCRVDAAQVRSLQAKAYARMGDRAGCHQSMRRSEEMAGRIRLTRNPRRPGTSSPDWSRCRTPTRCAGSAT